MAGGFPPSGVGKLPIDDGRGCPARSLAACAAGEFAIRWVLPSSLTVDLFPLPFGRELDPRAAPHHSGDADELGFFKRLVHLALVVLGKERQRSPRPWFRRWASHLGKNGDTSAVDGEQDAECLFLEPPDRRAFNLLSKLPHCRLIGIN